MTAATPTPITTTPRGNCPDALAAEVYRLTHAAMRKRFKIPGNHRTGVPEAVGTAYVRWLATGSDKTQWPADVHVYWLSKTATALLLGGDPGIEKQGRALRCIANRVTASQFVDSDRGEYDPRDTIFRAHYEVTGADHEDSVIDALDLAHRAATGRPCATWREALDCLLARGWTRCHLADAMQVSYSLMLRYLNRSLDIAPRPWRQQIALDIAAEDRLPPTGQARTVAPTYRKRRSVDSLRK